MSFNNPTRRGLLKTGAVASAGLALPTYLRADGHAGFLNAPQGDTVTLGFNVPQSGPYADEGAYELAVEHLNGGGDGGLMNTFSSKALKGNGILGKKVEYVTGDTQTKSDAARASAKSMIEKDGAVMITGGSSSGVAVAVQALCQEAGIIFMAGLTHSNDTTGKDKNHRRSGPHIHRSDGLGNSKRGEDTTGVHRLLFLHRACPELRCRRSGTEPLRWEHGQLADQRGSVWPARQADQRQEL